ncbi:pilus assembly protein [Anaeromyxobacter paludicola]|uniref:Tfp pilus assembly protein tip-associated adhesin PilY1-like protein n=1 Tax=Anaeromyxobacter paludicola TaxID=2918171 RepID=A0ABN6N7A9_9BACT|nr:hypothetical protein [Anaeromyxobacter paludicola]BDG09042.1 hypothetical protein AMPC_21550 [Anaeromyxobacter paludicola]
MNDRPCLDPRPRSRTVVALAVAAALALPTAASATLKQFNSGSLIIPDSIEYQSNDGIVGSYGLVYLVLYKNAARVAAGQKPITIYWVVEPNKLSQYRCNTMTNDLPQYTPTYNDNDGCDFAVQRAASAGGQPVKLIAPDGTETAPFNVSNVGYTSSTGPYRCGNSSVGAGNSKTCSAGGLHTIGSSTTVVKYLGGAWVVDSTDRAAFLGMLATVPELAQYHASGNSSSNYVNIHSAQSTFQAPVVSVLTQKPPTIALIGSSQTAFLGDVLVNAGLCSGSGLSNCKGVFQNGAFTQGPGVVYDYYPTTGDLLDASSTFPNGRLNAAVPGQTYGYGLFWAGDGASPTSPELTQVGTFLDAGNNGFVEYDSIGNVEAGLYQTTAGVSRYTSNVSVSEDCNDDALATGSFFKGDGTSDGCLIYAGANQPYAQTGNFLFDGGQGNYKAFSLNSGSTFRSGVTQVLQVSGGPTVASARKKDNNTTKGLMLYVAGHKFDNTNSNGQGFWGERLIMNSIFGKLYPLTPPELARSEPVGYKSPVANATAKAYQGTYVQEYLPDSNDVMTYNPAQPQIWQYPFTPGHLYQYDVSGLSTASQSFSANKDWDAATRMPLPGSRSVFTVVGGSANLGWKKISFDYTQTAGSTCLKDPATNLCYLSELLAATNSAGYTSANLTAEGASASGPISRTFGMLVQQARGFCAAHDAYGAPKYTPGDSDCDCAQANATCGTPQTNRAVLGGIDHGSPAVVGPSKYVTDSPWSTRPVVAYAAGHDGMLHAFYVGTGGATSWSAEGQSLPSGVQAGQELWAFLPPGQVGNIATNFALVDGSINVIDAFGDFPYDRNDDGVIDWSACTDLNATSCERPNHVRRWRTVLIASAGPGGAELFALDVTNPLKPVLLWDLRGATDDTGKFDLNGDGAFGTNEVFDQTVQSSWALRWFDWNDGDSGTTWIPSDYNTTDATVISHLKTGRYDYRNLGYTYSTSVAKVWVGDAYQYLAFTATAAADWTSGTPLGYRGVEVFAVDVITGQKLWQWEHLYASTDASGIDNSIPPGVALGDIDANGSTDRIYVGDMEGHLWELSARDGRNLNYLPDTAGVYHSFPLFGTPVMTGLGPPAADAATKALYTVSGGGLAQQPLTTPIGEGRFTLVPTGTSTFNQSMLTNRLALVVGTMGVDWSIAPSERGHLYVLPSYPDMGTRLTAPIDLAAARNPLLYGVLLPQAVWDIQLGIGERVYGMPRVANNNVVFNTAFGSFTGDISSSLTDPGNLWIVKGNDQTVASNGSKSFGGALMVGDTLVVTTDTSIKKVAEATGTLTGGGAAQATFNRLTPAIVKTWEPSQQVPTVARSTP